MPPETDKKSTVVALMPLTDVHGEHLQVAYLDAFDPAQREISFDSMRAVERRIDAAVGFTRICRARASQMGPSEQALAANMLTAMRAYAGEVVMHQTPRWKPTLPPFVRDILPSAMLAYGESTIGLMEMKADINVRDTRNNLIELGNVADNIGASCKVAVPDDKYARTLINICRSALRAARQEISARLSAERSAASTPVVAPGQPGF